MYGVQCHRSATSSTNNQVLLYVSKCDLFLYYCEFFVFYLSLLFGLVCFALFTGETPKI